MTKKIPSVKPLLSTDLPIGPVKRGKVRDIYDLGKSLLLIATDRISAFDVILPDGIPGKGPLLTQISLHWFQWLEKEIGLSHHLITGDFDLFPKHLMPYKEVLEGRSLLVRKAKPLPIECIVRGFLAGGGWKEYQQTGAISGVLLPAGLLLSSELSSPIFTPSTKGEIGEHDVNISFDQVANLVGEEIAETVRSQSVTIYKKAAEFAKSRGILIADTKMEFGIDSSTHKVILIDELLTPDSSRFWPADRYRAGENQHSFDKQYLRDYLLSIHWSGEGPAPHLPEEVIQKVSERYLEAFERLTQP
ncbi:MAG: phosphoribosylaminoimidazolesuccinocarboxamide synthase [Nitrospirota bacterium]